MLRTSLKHGPLWAACFGIMISGVVIAFAAPGNAKPEDTITQVLIVQEAEYKAGVARCNAISIDDKQKIAQLLEMFPNALHSQKGSGVPGKWEAEYRVYVFVGRGSVVMLTVGANGTQWTAPASTGDLRTKGDFLELVKRLSQ